MKYQTLSENNTLNNIDVGDHAQELNEVQLHLVFLIEKVFRDTAILAERLGLPAYRKDVVRKMRSFANLEDIEISHWDSAFHSPALAAARALYSSLAVMTEGREVTGLGVFETILKNTHKIIKYANLEPTTEAEVRKAVLKVLAFSFVDVVREIPLDKTIKTYRPDIGVRSLMAAKFIDSEKEAKTALDGIYADMHGYTGHLEWRSFYAVLYKTSEFYSQADVERNFVVVKADLSWQPIVVVGQGGRLARK